MLLEEDEENESDLDYDLNSENKKKQNLLQNQSQSSTTTSTYLTDSENENELNDLELDFSKSNNKIYGNDIDTSISTINDTDSISSLSSDLSSISISTTSNDELNHSYEPEQLCLPDYYLKLNSSFQQPNLNSTVLNEEKELKTDNKDDESMILIIII